MLADSVIDTPYAFPEPTIFGLGEYARAPALTRRAAYLVKSQEDFAHLRGTTIPVIWKSGQSRKLGQCEKVRGTLFAFVPHGTFFVVTIFYDMCRLFDFTAKQMDALLDHELRHCGFDQKGAPIIVQHDVEEFVGTIKRYGLWFEDVQRFYQVCREVAA